MTELEKIKEELNSLTTRVNEFEKENSEETFTFNKEQLTELVQHFIDATLENVKENIKNTSFETDIAVELEFDSYNKQIEATLDEDYIISTVIDEIEGINIGPDEVFDDIKHAIGRS